MLSKALSTTVLGLVASSLVSAQTFTKCDPLLQKCPDNAAAKPKAQCDLSKECSMFEVENMASAFTKGPQGLACTIAGDKQAPTLITRDYIFFGRVDVSVKAAPSKGIVTSVVLQSNDRDEIDWEWIGSNNTHVQSNYFSKGRAEPYNRGDAHQVANPINQFHKYSIEWTRQVIVWSIDDAPVRTLTYAQANGGEAYPQTPMQVKLGTWVAGGKDAPSGTANWAGGYTDFSQAPFVGYYQSVSIVNYNGKDGAGGSDADADYKYVWTDHSGSWQSIQVVKGNAVDIKDGHQNNKEDAKHGESSHSESNKHGDGQRSTSVASAASANVASSAGVTETTMMTAVSEGSSVTPSATPSPVATISAAASGSTSAYGLVIFAGVCTILAQTLL